MPQEMTADDYLERHYFEVIHEWYPDAYVEQNDSGAWWVLTQHSRRKKGVNTPGEEMDHPMVIGRGKTRLEAVDKAREKAVWRTIESRA